jgi:putative transposase
MGPLDSPAATEQIPAAREDKVTMVNKYNGEPHAFLQERGNVMQGIHGMPPADLCRKPGISEATYFNAKTKFDGLPTERPRLKQIEAENFKLKRIVAELSLDNEILQDAIRRKV